MQMRLRLQAERQPDRPDHRQEEQMEENRIVIDAEHVTVRFNMANQYVNNLKEYIIRLAKRQLMFQEFLALKDVDCRWGRGVLGHYRQERRGEIHAAETGMRDFKTLPGERAGAGKRGATDRAGSRV